MSLTPWADGIFLYPGEPRHPGLGFARAWRPLRLGVALILFLTACRPPRLPYPEALQSERPRVRARAIKQAAQMQDHSVIGILVDRLEDEDEAVRFYAILALEQLTGTRLGYEYHAPELQRWRAVQRWGRYLAEGQSGHRGVGPGPDLAADGGSDP